MARIEAEVRLVESVEQIERRVRVALAKEVNQRFARKRGTLEEKIKDLIDIGMRNSYEVDNIRTAPILYELGLTDVEQKLNTIINVLVDSVEVNFKEIQVRSAGFVGGFEIKAIRNDYSDILSLEEAVQINETSGKNKVPGGQDYEILHWLRWLLFEGSNIIIREFHVLFKTAGRTGGAVMVPKGWWSVPESIQGIPTNNFITRTIDRIKPQIEKEISECLAQI